MARKPRNNSREQVWKTLDDEIHKLLPHLYAVLSATDDFRELRLKARDDGTTLAIAKSYESDGTPIVCFGSGYSVSGALVAIDATIQGGNWKVDKPWSPSK